jgi:hypothetical protein
LHLWGRGSAASRSELRQLRAEEDEAVGRERDEVERGLHKTAPVVCRGLGKDYGGHTALHSLSLALRAGEVGAGLDSLSSPAVLWPAGSERRRQDHSH